MDGLIRRAITDKKLIRFRYHGHARVCEPHVYGRKDGRDGVLTYQVGGTSKSGNLPDWRRVYFDEMSGFEVTAEMFMGARPYHGHHSSWDQTYAIVV